MTTRGISAFNAFLMLVLITLWGSSFVVVKIALRNGLTPIAIATFRFLIAGALFLAILFIRKIVTQNKNPIEWKDLPAMLLLALSGITFFFTAQYTGIQMAGAAVAAILVCLLSPILITLLSATIFREYISKKQALGIGIAAVGTLIVIGVGSLRLEGNQQFLTGSLILLATPVLWTAYSLLGKKMMEKYTPIQIVSMTAILGGLCLVPLSAAENSLQQLFTTSPNVWLAILYLSLTCTLLGYYIWFYVLEQVGASIASSFLFAEPLITGFLATMLVGEEITLSIFAGGFLIFAGVYLVTR